MSKAKPRAAARVRARQTSNPKDSTSVPPRAIRRERWKALKRSIVAAGASGAISPERASGLIKRFGLREL